MGLLAFIVGRWYRDFAAWVSGRHRARQILKRYGMTGFRHWLKKARLDYRHALIGRRASYYARHPEEHRRATVGW